MLTDTRKKEGKEGSKRDILTKHWQHFHYLFGAINNLIHSDELGSSRGFTNMLLHAHQTLDEDIDI